MFMVDWITAKIPFFFPGVISDGDILFRDSDGEVERRTIKRLSIRGSHCSGITIRSTDFDSDGNTTQVEISGNPVKFIQGHNLFGTTDVVNVVIEAMLIIIKSLDIPQPNHVLERLFKGYWTISTIDLNRMLSAGTRADALAYLYSTSQNSRTRSQSAISKGSTVYLNKDSRRWVLKMYAKAQELELKRNKKQDSIILPSAVLDWVQPMVRQELRLKSNELREHPLGLHIAANWNTIEVHEIFFDYFGRVTMAEQIAKTGMTNHIKSRPVAATYQLWLDGHDVRQIVPKRTFYRHRSYLLENHKIDISLPPPDENKPCSNVVPLRKTIELTPAEPPHWIYGTDLFFEPRKLCTA